jgi:hypothetical protein
MIGAMPRIHYRVLLPCLPLLRSRHKPHSHFGICQLSACDLAIRWLYQQHRLRSATGLPPQHQQQGERSIPTDFPRTQGEHHGISLPQSWPQ